MAKDLKWIDWKWFTALVALAVISWAAFQGFDFATQQAGYGGCFRFNDGTTQGWNLDQLYDTSNGKQIASAQPGSPPTYLNYTPFALGNHGNIALQASSGLFAVPDPAVKDADFFFESPDLAKRADWQGINGYRLDLRRDFTAPCGEPKNRFFAQLQMELIDKATGKSHYIAPKSANGKDFLFHEIQLATPTQHEFVWGNQVTVDGKTLGKSGYTVKSIRIRHTMPARNITECWYSGTWRIGNVCSLK